ARAAARASPVASSCASIPSASERGSSGTTRYAANSSPSVWPGMSPATTATPEASASRHRKGRVSSLGATGEREHVRRCEKPFDVLRRRERDELVVDAEAARVRLRLGARSDCHRRNRDAAATQFADRRAQEVATLEAPRPAVVEDDRPVTRKADRRA